MAPEPQARAVRPDVTVSPLESEADWLAVRHAIERLEPRCAPNPWMLWESAFALWRHFHSAQVCWCVEASRAGGGAQLAAALWLEETQRRRGLTWRVLRSLDSMALRIPPCFIARDAEDEACAAIAAAMPMVARATGCDLVSLCRVDGRLGRMLLRELQGHGITARARDFTLSRLIRLPDDFEGYLARTPRPSTLKNLRYAERKIVKDLGAPAADVHVRGRVLGQPGAAEAWRAFLRLRADSWQVREAPERDGVDLASLDAWFLDMVRAWDRRGLIDLHLIRIGDAHVAAGLNLSDAETCWVTFTYFDREYAKYSVGTLLFLRALASAHQEGARHFDLGGEGSDWKVEWSTDAEPLLALEWPLGGPKGLAWRLMHRAGR